MTKATGREPAAEGGAEAGFTLLEVVIALTVVFGALASLAFVGTASLTDVALAKSRRAATGLADQALEQVRALPYDTVAKGLDNADLALGGDPNITQVGSTYFFDGEPIPRGDNPAIAPLVPHRSTVTLDEVEYTVSTYVTYYAPDTTGKAFRVSVIVSWLNHLRGTEVKQMEAQTVVYAGAACQAPANHPFPAPCQPFFYGNGSVAPGGFTITKDVFTGADLDQATVQLPHPSSSLTIEQSTSILSKASTGSAFYRLTGDTADTGHSAAQVQAYADNDPSSAGRPEYDTANTTTGTLADVTVGATGNTFTLRSSSSDAVSAQSAVAASLSHTCTDVATPPANQTDGRPCGRAATSTGSEASTSLAVDRLGIASLASVSGVTSDSFTKRIAAAGASVCSGTLTGSDGCAHVTARQTITSLALGGGFSGLTAPPGFTGLLTGTGISTKVTAEAGIGSAAPAVTRTGTISYWNGAGYSTLSLTAASTELAIPAVTMSNIDLGDSVTITPSLRTGSTSAPACAAPCASASATAESPIVGTMRYQVVRGGVTVADFTLKVDLGALEANAVYVASQQ